MRKLILLVMLLFAVGMLAQSTVVVGGGGISNTATTNGIPRTDANGNLVASAITDNGTVVTSTERVTVPDGAIATPALNFSGATNTGAYRRNSTGQFVVVSGGSESAGFAASGVTIPGTYCTGTAVDTCDTYWQRLAVGNWGANGSTGKVKMGGQVLQVVTSNYTTSATTLAAAGVVTGLNFTTPASLASNWSFTCNIMYSQATAAVANLWGVTTAGTAPTTLLVGARVYTSNAGAQTAGNAIITTATSTTVVTATPSAFGAIGTSAAMFQATIWGTIEAPSNASPSQVGIAVATGNASDALTVYRGSSCWWY